MPLNMVTTAAAVLSSGALSAAISGFISHRTSKSVEHLKTTLERGLYVTKAHYDLELESFKRLWAAVSDLRLKVRGFLGPDKFRITTPMGSDANWAANAFPGLMKDFFAAHDTVVRAVTETSPFYPAAIRIAAERTFNLDLQIIKRIATLDIEPMSEPWLVEMRELSGQMDRHVHQVEELIRARLESLRILS
jgi:hypothetical protein